MPFSYTLTSPKTGMIYDVDAAAELSDSDIDALVQEQDFETARLAGVEPGVDPAVLQQSPLGTFVQGIPNQLAKTGSAAISGTGRILDRASTLLSDLTGLPKGGTVFEDMARYGDDLSTFANLTFPTNPQNPQTAAFASGTGQGLSLLAGGALGKVLTGSNAAMTAVPLASGFLAGANEGIQQAERVGVTSPGGQLAAGAAFGGIEALSERLGLIGSKAGTEMLLQSVRKSAGEMAKQFGKAVPIEPLEELIAGTSQDALTRLMASEDPKRPGYTTTGVKLSDLADEIVNLEKRKLEAIGGLGGGLVFAGAQVGMNQLLPRANPNDPQTPNQAPTAPQSPTPTPAQPVAGAAAGAPLTPLAGIAQRGGRIDPTLPEDTGGLTVQDVETVSPSATTASVTKDSAPTADQTAQQAGGAGLSPAAGTPLSVPGTVPVDANNNTQDTTTTDEKGNQEGRQGQGLQAPLNPATAQDPAAAAASPPAAAAVAPEGESSLDGLQTREVPVASPVVFNEPEGRLKSNNRRRVVAAIEAGITQIPGRVEIGRASELSTTAGTPSAAPAPAETAGTSVAREGARVSSGQTRASVARAATSPNTSTRVTSAQDADYLEAVRSGDMEKAQRLVDEAAKRAGYSDGPLWHRTWSKFTEFIPGGVGAKLQTWFSNSGKQRTKVGPSGRAIFLSYDKEKTPAFHQQKKTGENFVRGFAQMKNPLVVDDDTREFAVDVFADGFKDFPLIVTEEARASLERAGHDSVHLYYNGRTSADGKPDEVILFNPSQIKSADPVTYDDAGNIIPLSQRFNETTPDIRFSQTAPGGLIAVESADSGGAGGNSPAGLFTYDAVPENSLTAGEQEALRALRADFPGERITPVTVTDVQGVRDTPRRTETRRAGVRQFAQAFQSLFGKRVVFFDGPTQLNGAVASAQQNLLLVNVNSQDPLLYTLGHELTHSLKRQNPDLYRQLERELLASGRNLDEYRGYLRGLGYEEAALNEELVADFVGSQLNEPGFLNQLAQEKPGLFARFAHAVLKFLNTLLGKVASLSRDVRPHFAEQIEPLRDRLKAILKEYSKTGKFPDNPLPDAAGTSLSVTSALATVLPLHETGTPFRVKNIALRRVLTGSPLPSELVGVLDMTENERQAVMQASAQIAQDLESAVNAHAKRTGRRLADIWADVNTVMEGQPGALMLLRATDPDLAEFARRARNLLDELSDAVAKTLPAGELRNAIVQNMGQWMRRGYAAFDPEANWNYDSVSAAAAAGKTLGGKDARKILANAKAYLRRQNPQGGRTVKEWDADIEADMRDLMDRDQWEAAMADGATVRKGVSSFMKRKDIPAEIRALMGEETNPLIRYARSAKFQAQIIARHHGQIAMRNLGLTTGLFSTEHGGVYTEQVPTDTRWSGMAGVWTTPQLMKAFQETTSTDLAGKDIGGMFINSMKALGNEAKLNKVALNPGSWVVNILGNVVAVVQSGDVFYHDFIRKVNDARGILRSGKVATTAAAAALGDAQREMLQRLRAAGVTGSTITLADIEASLPRHLLAWAADDATRNAALGAVKGAIFGQSLARVLGAPGRIVGGAIGAAAGAKIGVKQIKAWQEAIANYVMTGPDALARVTGWLTNYETALASGLTPDQANAQATEKTLNTFPNYQKLPALLRSLSRIGFAGSFIAFQYEVYRNYGWNVAYAVREINSGNPAQRARGFRRLAGLVAVSSLAAGGLGALLTAAGLAGGADDERNKLFRKWFARPWEKDAVLAFSKFDGDKVGYYNTSYLLPQVTMVELAQAATQGESAEDAAGRVISRLWEQFGASSVHLGPLIEAYTGQTRDGFPISNKESAIGRGIDQVDHLVESTMESGFSAQFERVARAMLKLDKYGRSYTIDGEIKYLAGVREQTREWEKLVEQRYSKFTREYNAARQQAKATISENAYGAKPQALATANERIARLQTELAQYEKDLARLGIAPAIVTRARKNSNLIKLRPVRLTKDGTSVETDPKAPLVPVR